jgi:tetratricopeptide (TPR) repeat protein
LAIEIGAAKEIANATDLEVCKKIQIRSLNQDRFIEKAMAVEVVDLLAFVLRGDQNKSTAIKQTQNVYTSPPPQNAATINGTQPPQSQKPPNAPRSSIKNVISATLIVSIIGVAIWTFNANDKAQYESSNTTQSYKPKEENANDRVSQARGIFDSAYQASEHKDYNKAVMLYTRGIEINPDYANAYNYRGFAYSKLGDHSKAIADYNQAIKINPDYASAYNNRGFAYARQKDYKKATQDAKKACELGNCSELNYLNKNSLVRN